MDCKQFDEVIKKTMSYYEGRIGIDVKLLSAEDQHVS
jgi:hypothetical protein